MYGCSSSGFAEAAHWLRGFEDGVCAALPNQPPELDGFREWLQMELDGPANQDWVGIIGTVLGAGREVMPKVFELVDRFLEERSKAGLEAILKSHADFELQRYGFLSSSRFRPNAASRGGDSAESEPGSD